MSVTAAVAPQPFVLDTAEIADRLLKLRVKRDVIDALPREKRRRLTDAEWFEYGFHAGIRETYRAVFGDEIFSLIFEP